MKIYIHSEAQLEPEGRDVSLETSLTEILPAGNGSSLVILREDGDDELEGGLTLGSAGISDRDHLFVGAHGRVAVEVMYNGETRVQEFSASARVERVFVWAV